MLKILTPDGWSEFKGTKKTPNRNVVHTDGLTCTPEHLLKLNDEFIEADKHPNFMHTTGYVTDVYDVLGVALGQQYYTNGQISHNCHFRGSSLSLLSGSILDSLVVKDPEEIIDDLCVFYPVEDKNSYVMIVDSSEGIGSDFHSFSVVDITKIPYEVVATYNNNRLSPLLLPNLLYNVGTKYNNALILIENMSTGGQVASDLYYDLEYENVLMTTTYKGRQILGFDGDSRLGVKTSKQIKAIGCSTIKSLIEDGKINLNDGNLIAQFGDFVPKGNSYAAASGANDDRVMTMVLFGWLSTQSYFLDMTDIDVRAAMLDELRNRSEEELMPFGIICSEVFGDFDGEGYDHDDERTSLGLI